METKVQGQPVNRSSQERMFYKSLDELEVKLEGFLFRPSVAWMPEQYGYRLTFPNGSTRVGMVDWNLDTFSVLLVKAREGAVA